MRIRTSTAAVLALAIAVSGSASAAQNKQPLQVEHGKIAVPGGEIRQARTGPYPMYEDRPITNGSTQWAFGIDKRTRGTRFSLAYTRGTATTDTSTAGGDAFGIVFYDEKGHEVGTVNNTYGGQKAETGTVPVHASFANVISDYGLNMPFTYKAG